MIYNLALLLNILNLADVTTTIYALENTPLREANPLMAYILEHLYYEGFIIVKLLVGAISSIYLYHKQRKGTLIFANVLLLLVVLSNLINIWMLG